MGFYIVRSNRPVTLGIFFLIVAALGCSSHNIPLLKNFSPNVDARTNTTKENSADAIAQKDEAALTSDSIPEFCEGYFENQNSFCLHCQPRMVSTNLCFPVDKNFSLNDRCTYNPTSEVIKCSGLDDEKFSLPLGIKNNLQEYFYNNFSERKEQFISMLNFLLFQQRDREAIFAVVFFFFQNIPKTSNNIDNSGIADEFVTILIQKFGIEMTEEEKAACKEKTIKQLDVWREHLKRRSLALREFLGDAMRFFGEVLPADHRFADYIKNKKDDVIPILTDFVFADFEG